MNTGDERHNRIREHNRSIQHRSRWWRTFCRRSILVCGTLGLGALAASVWLDIRWLGGFACLLLPLTLLAATVLFLLGGLNARHADRLMTERERKLLDD